MSFSFCFVLRRFFHFRLFFVTFLFVDFRYCPLANIGPVTSKLPRHILLISLSYSSFCLISGGTFNRTARIKYNKGGDVIIEQRYFGQTVLNNIRMETFINGTIPDINPAEKITVDDYKEDYTRISPGTSLFFVIFASLTVPFLLIVKIFFVHRV